MENYIRDKYGDDIFFITGMATECLFHEIEYLEIIKDLITREKITEIFIVNDISCRFINSLIKNEKPFGIPSEEKLQNIFIDNYSLIMHQPSIADKAKTFAELNIRQQAVEIMGNELFKSQIIQNNLQIKGLITAKSENKITEIKLNAYEL